MKKFMYCTHNYTPVYLRILSGQNRTFSSSGRSFWWRIGPFQAPPSVKLVDEWSPTPDSEATKSDRK